MTTDETRDEFGNVPETASEKIDRQAWKVFEGEMRRLDRSRNLNVILKRLGLPDPTIDDLAAVTMWADAHVSGGLEALRNAGLLIEGAPADVQVEAVLFHRWDTSTGYCVCATHFTDEREHARHVLEAAGTPPINGKTSDGHHTFDELYDYRMLYNAHAAHGWHIAGIPVVKSWHHSDGEPCFGGGWFIVTATLPTGQVSNHYRAEHWEIFNIPEVHTPPEWDGHTPTIAAQRLRDHLQNQITAALAAERATPMSSSPAPKRYRKKPVEIEAMQWDGTAEAATPIIQWMHENDASVSYDCLTEPCSGDDGGHAIVIRTLEGDMTVSASDFVIRGVQGEFYPCKPDIFLATYDVAGTVLA